jgi:hypothetical protein
VSATAAVDWTEANQRYLMAALGLVAARIEDAGGEDPAAGALDRAAAALPGPSALDHLCAAFGLSAFERELLLLCAGVELDSSFAAVCPTPTFGVALARLSEPHWSALTPVAPLRRWRLVELLPGETLTASPLRIDERTLHYLAGINHLDERLLGLVEPVAAAELPDSQSALAGRAARLAAGAGRRLVQLCGADADSRRAIAAAAAASLGLQLHALQARETPATAAERETLGRLWEREATLGLTALLLEVDEDDSGDATAAALAFADDLRGVVLASAPEPLRPRRRAVVRLDVRRPQPAEQEALWRSALGDLGERLNGQLEPLAGQFDLGAMAIEAAAADHAAGSGGVTLWDACRVQARPRLEGLARRIEPAASWDDLVLPEPQLRLLAEMALHVRQRAQVHERWGFAARSGRGLGMSALFAGPSGTGKTMAAEVLAGELRLDLYLIDLSSVVSKYIGETEKNLRRIFDAAEHGGAMLLFDEADALFGKRSEVKDSHDRYANIEVSYLLQRMEAYRGLAILTTNMKGALDAAFLRRLRFVVQFPFPEAEQRAEIWRRVFPPQTPTEGLDAAKLARVNVAGGSIRNIALGAAFLAADAGEPVRMGHLLRAARGELAKLERPLTEAEIGGWT